MRLPKNIKMNRNLFFFLLFLLPSCAHDHEHGDGETTEENNPNEAALTMEQMENIGLELGRLTPKNLNATLKVNGQLELPPQNQASVSSMAAGIVRRIHVRQGERVKKGQVLATLEDPSLIEIQQAYLEAKGELLFLDKEFARQKKLSKEEVAAVKKFEKTESERAVVMAKLQAAESKMRTLGIVLPEAGNGFVSTFSVRSPLSGYVRQIETNTGAYAQPRQELFEIVDNHHIHIDLMVFEKDLHYLKVGQKLQFVLQSDPSEVMEATVFAIGKALDEELRAVPVHAEIDNKKGELLPGMYVEARLVLTDRKVSALPEDAISVDKGVSYIFVKEEEHEGEVHFLKVPVKTGASDLGYVEVTPLEKLLPEVEIVIKGAFFLMAQTKKGEGGGHSHEH